MARLRAAKDKKLADWLAGHVDIAPDGCVRVQVNNISRESLARALSMLLQLASGGHQPPRGDAVMRLVEQILATNTRQRHTLSGVVVTAKKGELTLQREVAAIPDMALEGDVWDSALCAQMRRQVILMWPERIFQRIYVLHYLA